MKLRPFQKQVLSALSRRKHVICVAPTGSGKSYTYERWTHDNRLKTLLLTPLIALGRQQFHNAKKLGIEVSLGIGSPVFAPPVSNSGGSIWVMSPEKLFGSANAEINWQRVNNWGPDFLVVDECHCIWEWGSDFRKAFYEIPTLVKSLKIQTSLWLTATLPQRCRKELNDYLSPNVIEIGDFQIPQTIDLQIKKMQWPNRALFLKNWMESQKEAGILFVSTRRMAHRLTRFISHFESDYILYHAGMSREERENTEEKIKKDQPKVIIATSAFGMGMDYNHLRWCIVWQTPLSLLSFAQQIGRVGRNKKKGTAILFWSEEDFQLNEWALSQSQRKKRDLLDVHRFLQNTQNPKSRLETYFNH